MNILDTILYLNPNAKCAVWECSRDKYQGESEPVEINGYLIDWNPTNTQRCPTQAELEACDPAAVKAYIAGISETRRKTARDGQSKKDLALVQGYLGYKVNNPGVKFSEYLDFLEAASLEL